MDKLKLKKQKYIINVPLDEITCRGTYLGQTETNAYFKLDDGRYTLINLEDIKLTGCERIGLKNFLDVRENKHFISKKDWSTILKLEGEV